MLHLFSEFLQVKIKYLAEQHTYKRSNRICTLQFIVMSCFMMLRMQLVYLHGPTSHPPLQRPRCLQHNFESVPDDGCYMEKPSRCFITIPEETYLPAGTFIIYRCISYWKRENAYCHVSAPKVWSSFESKFTTKLRTRPSYS